MENQEMPVIEMFTVEKQARLECTPIESRNTTLVSVVYKVVSQTTGETMEVPMDFCECSNFEASKLRMDYAKYGKKALEFFKKDHPEYFDTEDYQEE